MAYFLRKEKKKKGTYLQMYESFWDKNKKQPRTKNVKSFGYVEDLISGEIPDPVKFYSDYVKEQNENRTKVLSEEYRPRAFSTPVELNIGHFLLYSLIDELDVKETIDIIASQMRFQFSVFDLITQLIYARVISPCSKSKTASHVFPYLYGSSTISEDQVYDGCSFIGESYKKYIDLFNRSYERYSKRDLSNVFFDCTNILTNTVLGLFRSKYKSRAVRSIAVKYDSLVDESYSLISLFDDVEAVEREEKLQSAIDGIRDKFGFLAVLKGTALLDSSRNIARSKLIGGHSPGGLEGLK